MDNLDSPQTLVLFALIFIAAVLYASVGHGGASGYLAAMALFGVTRRYEATRAQHEYYGGGLGFCAALSRRVF